MSFLFFFNDTATTEIYTLSLHDALPIYRCRARLSLVDLCHRSAGAHQSRDQAPARTLDRSEEHTSELQSRSDLVCRLLLEKKKTFSSLSRPPSFTPVATAPAVPAPVVAR